MLSQFGKDAILFLLKYRLNADIFIYHFIYSPSLMQQQLGITKIAAQF